MKIKNFLIALLLIVVSAVQAQDFQMPALPLDPAVRIGKLDNGLTYYIRHNNWPENRANFYIAQKVGSIQEEESQRGLAHFLEHMAFNGSKNFAGNKLIEYCRSIGVEFGSDLNAYTSIDETVYRVDNVPTANQAVLDSVLLILSDWSNALTLATEEIDKERGVIHEEWRLRTSASSRMFERNLEKLYPGSKYGKRYPIGLMSVIDNFKPKELRDYYEKWYHPVNQGIIIIGNIDLDHTEAMIKKYFGSFKSPENAAPIEKFEVPDNAEPIIIVDKDKEQRTSGVEIMFKHDGLPAEQKGTQLYYIDDYIKQAVSGMLATRFTEAAQKAECPYVSAMAYDGEYIFAKTKDAFGIDITPKDPNNIEAALKAAVIEVRRAIEFGFTATEYSRFQQDFLSSLEKRYSNKDKRTNTQFYSGCKGHFIDGEPMPSIEVEYELYKQFVPMIPVDAINMSIKELISESDSNVVIINFNNEREGATYPTEASLLNALHEARAAEISAFVDNVKNEPLIAKMPKAGKIKKEVKNDKFGYTELTLSNGVTVVLKKTDFKKDEVSLSGFGGAGSTVYPAGDVNTMLFDNVISISGLGNFSLTELQKALSGKIANVDLTMGERVMSIDGSSTPKDVETMLQMAYLYFTNINKDVDSYNNLINQLQVQLKNRALSPEIAFSDSVSATLYGHDLRKKPLLLEDLDKVSYDRILEMAKERTQSAAGWEFTIIGNFDEETIRPLICQYLGALPSKKVEKSSPRKSFFVKGEVENVFKRKQETPKAISIMLWSNTDMEYTHERNVQIDMIGQVLSMEYIKKIREDASAAYSCGAAGVSNISLDGYRQFIIQAYCPMKPDMSDVAMKIMRDEVSALTQNVDAEKLKNIKELMIKQYDDNQNKNNYWSNVVFMWRKYGIDINTNGKQVIESQTPETLKAFMKEFLKPGNRVTAAMLPE